MFILTNYYILARGVGSNLKVGSSAEGARRRVLGGFLLPLGERVFLRGDVPLSINFTNFHIKIVHFDA